MRIEIYVQLAMSAELYGMLTKWNATEKQRCQEIANNMKAEVRAMQGDSELARFYPLKAKENDL